MLVDIPFIEYLLMYRSMCDLYCFYIFCVLIEIKFFSYIYIYIYIYIVKIGKAQKRRVESCFN